MKYINMLAYILVIVGALNWGLIGVFDINLVTLLFGEGSVLTRIVYTLVGASALVSVFMIIPLIANHED